MNSQVRYEGIDSEKPSVEEKYNTAPAVTARVKKEKLMEKDYGFKPGDRLEVVWGEEGKRKSQIVTVVQEGTYEIQVDVGEYRAWIMKCDLVNGDLSIRKIGGEEHERAGEI